LTQPFYTSSGASLTRAGGLGWTAEGGRPYAIFWEEAEVAEHLGGGFAAGANAIGDSDAAVAVAGEGEAGGFLEELADPLEAVEVSDGVLGHGVRPLVDPGGERDSGEATSRGKDFVEFAANDG